MLDICIPIVSADIFQENTNYSTVKISPYAEDQLDL